MITQSLSTGTRRSVHRYLNITLAVTVVLSLCSATVGALELDGRFRSELHTWSQDSVDHIRPYQSLQSNLTVWRGSAGQRLSFSSYLRWTTGLADKLESDPQLFVYDAYLRYEAAIAKTNIYVGRQFVYSGVGSALIDGVRLKARVSPKIRAEIHGGSSVDRTDPEQIRSFSDYMVVGGRLSFGPFSSTRFGLNWIVREDEGEVSFNRAGIDLRYTGKAWQYYSRASYNMVQHRLASVIGRLTYSSDLWYASGEFLWREPSVAANSVFAIVDFQRYRQARSEIRRKIRSDLSLVLVNQVTIFDEGQSYRFALGVRSSRYSLLWNHQAGGDADSYTGERDGISGSVNYPIADKTQLYGRVSFNRYQVQYEQVDRSDAYETGLGLSRQFARRWNARIELQYLRNAVQSNASRLYLGVTKRFSVGRNKR